MSVTESGRVRYTVTLESYRVDLVRILTELARR
jgi:hypothetical protein